MNEEIFYVNSNIVDQIATVTFYHPKSNSFPTSQLNSLIKKLDKLSNDDNVKVIILQSKGENVFCAGASFDELLTLDTLEKGTKFFMGFANVLLAMKKCKKMIIGNIQGKVVGGGVGLVAACDYAIATQNASVKLSELSIGIGPFVIEPAIRRKVGLNALSELTLQPKVWQDSEWCLQKGLYNTVVKNTDQSNKAAQQFAENLTEYSLEALQEMKSIFWEETEDWKKTMPKRAEKSGKLILTDYAKEKLAQFKQK